jgi:hypothetical protein
MGKQYGTALVRSVPFMCDPTGNRLSARVGHSVASGAPPLNTPFVDIYPVSVESRPVCDVLSCDVWVGPVAVDRRTAVPCGVSAFMWLSLAELIVPEFWARRYGLRKP